MRKGFKKFVGSIVLVTALLCSPVSTFVDGDATKKVEAVSCKNPTLKKSGKGAYVIYHNKLKRVVVDGKTVKVQCCKGGNSSHPGYSCFYSDNCSSCNGSLDRSYIKLSNGSHKVEVYDVKGYYVIKYITVN